MEGDMGDDFPKFTAAVVQAAPIFLDRESTIDKACRLIQEAGQRGAYVAIGINERDAEYKGSLYNTLLYIDDRGRIIGKHRKLMPSYGERTVWGWGDGSGLQVFDTPLGRVGGLICWEHEMPLVRYAMYSKGEQVHCSVWPAYSFQSDHIDFGCRQYAFEGGCFVLVRWGLWNAETIPP